MASHRLPRVRELLKRQIGEVIRRELPISQAGLITVNDVEVSGDLQNASVFLSIFGSSEQQRTHHITISIGVASFPQDARDPIQLVEMADSALYRAKRSGRNRVCAYRPVVTNDVVRLRPRS